MLRVLQAFGVFALQQVPRWMPRPCGIRELIGILWHWLNPSVRVADTVAVGCRSFASRADAQGFYQVMSQLS